MTVTAVGSAWNPILIPRADGKWSNYVQGSSGSGATTEAGGDAAAGAGLVGLIGSGAAVEAAGDTASGTSSGSGTWAISGTGIGAKGNLQYWDDFESRAVGQYTAGQSIGSLVTVNGGPQVVNSKSASGSRSMYNDFASADFPEVYKAMSGAQTRAYMSCKLWIEGNGTVHIWKFGRIGSGSVYGGSPHAGASYGTDLNSFTGEIVVNGSISSYWAQNTITSGWASRFVKNQWLFYECEFYAGTVNNSDCVFLERVNGVLTTSWVNQPYLVSANNLLPTWFLTPFNGWDIATDMRGYIDEMYIDESRARVVMTDNVTYASSTKWENQPVQSWTYNSGTGVTDIVAGKRNGSSFNNGDTVYLHTFNDAGTLVKSESRTY